MPKSARFQAVSQTGTPGSLDRSTHSANQEKRVSRQRRKLDRERIIALIEERGSAGSLDLSYADLSGGRFGSGDTPMPPLDGAILGKYGDVMSGATARDALFARASLRRTKWIYTDLRRANFYLADLTEADLRFAELNDAIMVGAKLVGANLHGSDLSNVVLRDADLRGADLYLAKLSGRTDLRRANLGESILQEDAKAYADFVMRSILPDSKNPLEHHLRNRLLKAIRVYEHLKIHFEENGNLDDAIWAYRRERRVRKLWKGQQASESWNTRHYTQSIQLRASWASDWLVELLCDYGESVWRVLFWLLALLFVIGPVIICLFGGLKWNGENLETYFSLRTSWQRSLYGYFQYTLYMLDTITTANFSDLRPATDAVRLISGTMAMMGIFLTGLLGFVAGNRIRQS
jgi:uncharacterized protein YjbI with pentapeptide repeats